MKVIQVVLMTASVPCGFAAMGCWVLLQLGGVTSNEGPTTALIMYGSAALFGITVAIAAFLQNPRKGVNAIALRSMYLSGVCGLPVLLSYAVVSRGAVFQMAEYDCLLILFGCFAVFLRRKGLTA
ncbi:MAG: hypothetical protein ABJF23_01895 [Bryobacteraceae bacterium]